MDQDDWRLEEEAFVSIDATSVKDEHPGKYCPGNNIHPYLVDAAKADHCYTKCGPGGKCDGKTTGDCATCDGYMREFDDELSDAICLKEDDCWELCKKTPGCHAVETATDQKDHKRCYLNTINCLEYLVKPVSLSENADWKITFQEYSQTEECPLGYGARISFAAHANPNDPDSDKYGVVGIYDRMVGKEDGDPPVYNRVDGTGRIVWHTSSCGWVVENKDARRLAAVNAEDVTACKDDEEAANAAFGLAGDAKEPEICGRHGWAQSHVGYCWNALYAALCPASCGVKEEQCTGDNDDAAPLLHELLGVKAQGEAKCAGVGPFCAEPLVASVCKATCKTATLRRGTSAKTLPATFAQDFRKSMRRAAEVENQVAERRLGWSDAFYEVFYSFYPSLAPEEPSSCPDTKWAETSLHTTTLYDARLLHAKTAQSWKYDCGTLATYSTYEGKYCPHNNIQTYGAGVPEELSSERCVAKCDEDGELSHVPDGYGYCEGYDKVFTSTSNALCLPRAKCEELCTKTDGCKSFDMHLTLPRCWLNGPYCTPGENPYYDPTKIVELGIYEDDEEMSFVVMEDKQAKYATGLPGTVCEEAKPDSSHLHTVYPNALDVSDSPHSCKSRCSGAMADFVTVRNERLDTVDWKLGVNTDLMVTPAGVVVPGAGDTFLDYFNIGEPSTTNKTGAYNMETVWITGNIVVSVEFGSLVAGVVDTGLHDAAFGPRVPIPFAKPFNDTWTMGKVLITKLTAPGADFAVVMNVPGIGLGVVTGTVDEKRLEITLGEPMYVDESQGDGTVAAMDLTAVEDTLLVAGSGMKGPCVMVISDPVTDPKALSYMLSSDMKTTAPEPTPEPTPGPTYYYKYYNALYGNSLAPPSRKLAGHGPKTPLPKPLKKYTDFASFAEPMRNNDTIEMQIDAVGDTVVVAVKSDPWNGPYPAAYDELTVYVLDLEAIVVDYFLDALDVDDKSTGVKFVITSLNETMKDCGLWKGLAPVADDIFIVTCSSYRAVVCDAHDGTCGTPYTQSWDSTHHSNLNSTVGYDVACLSLPPTCLARTTEDAFAILSVDLGSKEITSVDTVENLMNEADPLTGMTIIGGAAGSGDTPQHVFIARANVYMSRYGEYDPDRDVDAFEAAGVNTTVMFGYTHGTLMYEFGDTWTEPAHGICDYFADAMSDSPTVNLTDTEVCGTRATCEQACTEMSGCNAFEFEQGSHVCRLYGACTEKKKPGTTMTTVTKTESTACAVEVTGAVLDPEILEDCPYATDKHSQTCDLNKKYFEESKYIFRTKDNASRIVFDFTSRTKKQCLGWSLQQNTDPATRVFALTYKDAPPSLLSMYHEKYEVSNASLAGDMPMCGQLCGPNTPKGPGIPPCEIPESMSGYFNCTANKVVAALCKAECTELETKVVADATKTFHTLTMPHEENGGMPGDDDEAAAELSLTYGVLDLDATCKTMCDCTGKKKSEECTDDEILLWICPNACQRKRSKDRTYYVEALNFLVGGETANYTTLFRTFANGSHVAYVDMKEGETAVPTYGFGQCLTTGPAGDRGLLTTSEVYRMTVPEEKSLTVTKACAKEDKCPTLTTCIQSWEAMQLDLADFRVNVSISERIAGVMSKDPKKGSRTVELLSNSAWTDFLNPPDFTDPNFNTKFPKVLISDTRAEAVLRTSLWEYGKEIFRSVPAHSRVRLSQFPATMHTGVVSLSDSVDWAAMYNFGRTYKAPKNYEPFLTDVVRLEAFDSAGAPLKESGFGDGPCENDDSHVFWYYYTCADWASDLTGSGVNDCYEQDDHFWLGDPALGGYTQDMLNTIRAKCPLACGNCVDVKLEFFIPGIEDAYAMGRLEVFMFGAKGPGKKLTAFGGSISALTDGWYEASIPGAHANKDFVATIDTDECAGENLCDKDDDGGYCVPKVDGYACACKAGFVGENGEAPGTEMPPGTQCIATTYDAPTQHFVLYHNDPVEYGWHVLELQVYEGADDAGNCLGVCQDGSMAPNCHYGKQAFPEGKGDTANSYISNIQVPGSYPRYPVENLKDNDDKPEGAWRSRDLALSRGTEGTGAWISFEVAPDVEVNCVRVMLDCAVSQPMTFTLHRGKVGSVPVGTPAYSANEALFMEPGKPGFISTVTKSRTAVQTTVDMAIPCGIKDAQYFGELFMEIGPDTVKTPCECKQICVDHVDEGCATWKWYGETSHCFLQRDVFEGTDPDGELIPKGALDTDRATYRPRSEKGRGWWKRPFAEGWPGWVTGEVVPVAMSLKTVPEVPVLGEPFTVSVHGGGFPLDESMADDLGARQRIKIIASDKSCVTEMPPDYVEGVDCTNWFTCSPRPEAYTRTMAKWTGLTITAQKDDTDYKVCWCWGQCWNVVNWQEVPGKIDVVASGYVWSFETAKSVTRATVQTGLDLRVSRPAFSSTTEPSKWRVKLVKDVFDCTALGDEQVCGGESDCGAPATHLEEQRLGPDEAIWMVNASKSVVSGDYHVCFSADGTVAKPEWSPIPSAATRFLTVEALASDSTHPRGPFHHQSTSAKAGKTATVAISGFRMWEPNQASLAVSKGDDCYIPTNGRDDVIAFLKYDATVSTATEYTFSAFIPADAKGKYTLCMCTPEDWHTKRADARPADWKASTGVDSVDPDDYSAYYYNAAAVQWADDAGAFLGEFTASADADFSPAYSVAESTIADKLDPAGTDAAGDLCFSKCSAGCIGATCFCDGLEDDDTATSKALCLSSAKCRDACNSNGDCLGYSMSKEKNRCYLAASITDTADTTDYDLFKAKLNPADRADTVEKPCQQLADFFALKKDTPKGTWAAQMEVKKNIGSLYVTKKVDVGVDYIATPGESTSIEVTGTGLEWAHDRVMVIDCYGTCGVTKGSTYSHVPGMDFDEWVPVNAHVDRPSLDEQPLTATIPGPKWKSYTKLDKQYCPGNMMIMPGSLADKHRCYKKCYEEAPCDDGADGSEACFCDGFINGYDQPDSGSICLDQTQCEYLCSVTPGCHSIDMSKDKTRCYLNSETECNVHVQEDTTVPDKEYMLLVKPLDDNERRLAAKGRALQASHVRKLLAAEDPGISWENILRFKDLKFSSGGEFKLCFCDSDLLEGTNEICDGPEDYTIEVGKVHATGLQCLLSNPKMTRGTCEKQEYGGLRCYDDAAPDVPLPVEFLGVPKPSGHGWTDHTKMLIAFCQFAPYEETSQFGFCDQWRPTTSPNMGGGGTGTP